MAKPKTPLPIITLTLDKIVGGGQTMGTQNDGINDGRKVFVWGGLPGETVQVQLTKKKSKMAEGIVVAVEKASAIRVEPKDPDSYLSTSPWQIMAPADEQHYKAALIEEAFELHDIVLPDAITVYTDEKAYEYRNKIEFSWWWDKERETLDLAFFRRGTHGKIAVDGTSLAKPIINEKAHLVRELLRTKGTKGLDLKTLLIRTDANDNVAMQLYVKNKDAVDLTQDEVESLGVQGFEVIYSNPKSPASVITERLKEWGNTSLTDTILDVPFTYAVEGFFQINLPVYEEALRDIKKWVDVKKPLVDLYSGVGTIGLTVTDADVTLVELNENAVREMKRNIESLGRTETAHAVLAASENAVEYITSDAAIIVDPPRAGLTQPVIDRLLEQKPERIIYLSCNPVTQARDVAALAEIYGIEWHRGYNFFPGTPHIEHLLILKKK